MHSASSGLQFERRLECFQLVNRRKLDLFGSHIDPLVLLLLTSISFTNDIL